MRKRRFLKLREITREFSIERITFAFFGLYIIIFITFIISSFFSVCGIQNKYIKYYSIQPFMGTSILYKI